MKFCFCNQRPPCEGCASRTRLWVRWPWGWRPWTWWPRATASTSSCARRGKVDRLALLQIILFYLIKVLMKNMKLYFYEGIWSQTATTGYFHQETRRCSNFCLQIVNLIELIFDTTTYVLKESFLMSHNLMNF